MSNLDQHTCVFLSVKPSGLYNTVDRLRELLPNTFCHVIYGHAQHNVFLFIPSTKNLVRFSDDFVSKICSFDSVNTFEIHPGIGKIIVPVDNWQFVRIDLYKIEGGIEPLKKLEQLSMRSELVDLRAVCVSLAENKLIVCSGFDVDKWNAREPLNEADLVHINGNICP